MDTINRHGSTSNSKSRFAELSLGRCGFLTAPTETNRVNLVLSWKSYNPGECQMGIHTVDLANPGSNNKKLKPTISQQRN